MIKAIELYFPDDFVPPEKFVEPARWNDWKCQCENGCPFFQWNDDFGGSCNFPFGEWDEDSQEIEEAENSEETEKYGIFGLFDCPIREYFE